MKVDSLGPALVAATAWGAAAGGATPHTAAGMITAVIRALAEVAHGKHAMIAHRIPNAGCDDFDVKAKGNISNVSAQDEPIAKSCEGDYTMIQDHHFLDKFQPDGIPPAPKGVSRSEVTSDIDANGISNVFVKDKLTGKSFERKRAMTKVNHLMDWFHADSVLPAPQGGPQSEAASDMDAQGILSMSVLEEPTGRSKVTLDSNATGVLGMSTQQNPTGVSLLLLDGLPVSMGLKATIKPTNWQKVEEMHAILADAKALQSQYVAEMRAKGGGKSAKRLRGMVVHQAGHVRKLEQQLATLEAESEAP